MNTSTTPPTQTHEHTLTRELELGAVELTVSDLDRSRRYYTELIGLQLLSQEADSIELGLPGLPLVVLREVPGASPAPQSSPGLSHFAPRVPTRADLARFAKHYTQSGLDADLRAHGNAESAYVVDPDRHTVEVTWHRPREQWDLVDGEPVIVADPITLSDLLTEPGADTAFSGLPSDTTMSHVQLKVTDEELTETEPFYTELIGLEVLGRLGRRFLALGVEDRSLLVVTNRFSHPTSPPVPEASAHLLRVELLVPARADLRALAARLPAAAPAHELSADAIEVRDPSGNVLRFRARRP